MQALHPVAQRNRLQRHVVGDAEQRQKGLRQDAVRREQVVEVAIGRLRRQPGREHRGLRHHAIEIQIGDEPVVGDAAAAAFGVTVLRVMAHILPVVLQAFGEVGVELAIQVDRELSRQAVADLRRASDPGGEVGEAILVLAALLPVPRRLLLVESSEVTVEAHIEAVIEVDHTHG